MLNGLIIASYILWFGGFFVNGFTLYQVMLIVPTTMFALRKFGIHIKMSNIVVTEGLLLFFSVAWRLLFHKFVLWSFIVSIIIRLIFICIDIYDDTVYVYVSEERKKK